MNILILAESLFKSLTNLVIFSTTEYRDISFANNYELDVESSDNSFMFIRKDNGPNRESCETTAYIATHEEYCPFRTTLWFCCYKKSVTVFNKLPDILFSLSLCRGP